MDVAVSPVHKSQIEFSVAVPLEEFETHVKRAARLISEERDFEGFRKGKAPYEIVKKEIGENRIYERAAELAVRRTYPDALQTALAEITKEPGKNQIPIGHPEITITKLAPGNELLYKAKVSLLPEVGLPDYVAIAARTRKKEKKDIVVTDAEISRAIDWLRESRTKETAVSRPARDGDAIEIDFEIRSGSALIDGGNSHNHPLVIGQKKFIPGFEDHLIGMAPGTKKEFTLVVPESWHDGNLRGKTLDIRTSMKQVRERAIPDLTDEFARDLGQFETKEKLIENVRQGLTQERREKERERIRMQIIKNISASAAIDIPDLLIEAELDKMFTELKSGIEQMGMKWNDYLANIKKAETELRTDWRTEADTRARVALTLREIAARESIEPSEDDITARANEFLARYKTAHEAEKEIDPDALKEYTRGVLRNEKVFEFLESQ
ncbi:MAG: Trigger factor [Parcubacteria group bacterium GW2011_GWB1_50_9]|nr:MAG: Trigger factor [Parcubacteria group bacterium GW2011_GWB1_50_9]